MKPVASLVEQGLHTYSQFDSAPYANLGMLDVARILDIETSRRHLNIALVMKLIDRVLAGLGHTLVAMQGRQSGARLARLLNRGFMRIIDRMAEFDPHVNERLRDAHTVISRLPLPPTVLPPPTLDRPLDEKLILSNYDSYAKLVADAYDARPAHDPAAKGAYRVLLDHVKKMFKQLLSRIRIEFVNEAEPYKDAADMTKRVQAEGVMYVSTLFSADLASGWSEHDNWMFRAVHDYVVHIGGHHSFSLRGELGTFNRHSKLVPPAALPALFSEVVGQVSYAIVRGRFPSPQKACVLYGFDYHAVGRMDPEAYKLNWKE